MRLFVAIPISKRLKEKIGAYQQMLKNLPLRLTPVENLHVTFIFLGEIPEREIPKIEQKIQTTLSTLNPLPYTLVPKKFEPGPNPRSPRLVWLSFKTSKELSLLQLTLAQSLKRVGERPLTPHITIARVLYNERPGPENVPPQEVSQALSFMPQVIHLMKSKVQRGGAKYTALKIFPLW